MTDPPAQGPSQGRAGRLVYDDLLKQLLTEEDTRKQSLEQRGLQVVSGVGALVTLLLALIGLAVNGETAVPAATRWLLILGVGAFVAAGVFAILTNKPHGYQVFGQAALDRMVDRTFWDGDETIAAWRVAQLRVQLIKQARSNNQQKARRLRQAIYAAGAGIGFLALGAAILLVRL
jgi:hypothetical protein